MSQKEPVTFHRLHRDFSLSFLTNAQGKQHRARRFAMQWDPCSNDKSHRPCPREVSGLMGTQTFMHLHTKRRPETMINAMKELAVIRGGVSGGLDPVWESDKAP